MRPHYIFIPLATVLVSLVGASITTRGLGWYRTLALPAIMPPGWFVSVVWTALFALAAASAIIVWNKLSHGPSLLIITSAFVINAALNLLWSQLFFKLHLIGAATVSALVLEMSVLVIIAFVWTISEIAAILLIPYAGWVGFATYLTYLIYILNA